MKTCHGVRPACDRLNVPGGERWLPVVPAGYLLSAHLHLHLSPGRQGEVRHRRGQRELFYAIKVTRVFIFRHWCNRKKSSPPFRILEPDELDTILYLHTPYVYLKLFLFIKVHGEYSFRSLLESNQSKKWSVTFRPKISLLPRHRTIFSA